MQETFPYQLFLSFILGLSCLYSFSFFKEEKSSPKKKKTLRDKDYQYSLLRTFKPMKKKNTIEGLTEEADEKKKLSKLAKTHHSHSWSPCFCTTDNTGSVITHFSPGCAREDRELRKASCRLLAKCEKGLGPPQAAGLKGNAI